MTRILIVDDSAIDRRVVGGLLGHEGTFSLYYARDGREGLDQIVSNPPDIILTDLQMPQIDGLQLVETVRRKYPLIPVIVMTAQGNEKTAVEALERGAASYVAKSQFKEDLVDIVKRVLAVSGQQRTVRSLMQRMRRMQCRFVLTNDPAMLTSLVAYLQNLLREMDLFPESDRLRIGVALEEALLNAAYHGNLEVSSELREVDHTRYYALARERAAQSPYCNRSVHVEVDICSDGARYVIRDEGPGFDPGTLPDPTAPSNLDRPAVVVCC